MGPGSGGPLPGVETASRPCPAAPPRTNPTTDACHAGGRMDRRSSRIDAAISRLSRNAGRAIPGLHADPGFVGRENFPRTMHRSRDPEDSTVCKKTANMVSPSGWFREHFRGGRVAKKSRICITMIQINKQFPDCSGGDDGKGRQWRTKHPG